MGGVIPAATLTAGDVLAAVAVGVVVFFAGVLGLGLGIRGRSVIRRRLEPHVRAAEHQEAKAAGSGRRALSSLFAATEHALGGFRLWRKLRAVLERADAPLSPAQFFYVMLASGLVPALLLAAVGAPAIVVVFILLVGALAPCLILGVKANRRQRAFDEQLPQVLMSMAASVRVGHSFRQAMQAVVKEDHGPAGKEFGRVLLETDLGRPLDLALSEMADRLASKELGFTINAITIQREVGGSLAGLFDLVAETVRHRQQFAAKVRGLTAMQRLSAYILTALPFLAIALLTAMNPSYTAPLFNTSTGRLLLIIAMSGIVLGGLILKKISSFRLA
jgi:tight adherence protein B